MTDTLIKTCLTGVIVLVLALPFVFLRHTEKLLQDKERRRKIAVQECLYSVGDCVRITISGQKAIVTSIGTVYHRDEKVFTMGMFSCYMVIRIAESYGQQNWSLTSGTLGGSSGGTEKGIRVEYFEIEPWDEK